MHLLLLTLADFPDPAGYQATGWISVVLFSLAGGTNQVLKLLDRCREKPLEKREVQLLAGPASRADLEGLSAHLRERVSRVDREAQAHKAESSRQFGEARQQLAAVVERMDSAIAHLDERRSDSITRLHEQLAGSEAGLAAVKKEAEIHTQQLAQLDAKITLLLQRR